MTAPTTEASDRIKGRTTAKDRITASELNRIILRQDRRITIMAVSEIIRTAIIITTQTAEVSETTRHSLSRLLHNRREAATATAADSDKNGYK